MTNPAASPAPVTSAISLRSSASPSGCWSAAWARRSPPAATTPTSTSNRSRPPRWASTSRSSNPPARAPAPAAAFACSSGERTGYAYTDNLSPERLLHAARTAALIASGPGQAAGAGIRRSARRRSLSRSAGRLRSGPGRAARTDSARRPRRARLTTRASCRCGPATPRSCAAFSSPPPTAHLPATPSPSAG